ncbi:MAG: hypothetical protein KA143_07600 [Saprospiraceae bacterium]|nr:hypothetical protein [Saprospiraceae bacterium]
MKYVVLTLLISCCFKSYSQASLYASFFGDDALAAANLDIRSENPGLLNYSLRGGIGVWSEWGKRNALSIPHHLTVILGKTHGLEVGASAAWRKGLGYRMRAVLGYRYQRRPSGLLIRTYVDPIHHGQFNYRFGLAIGHSF